MHQRADDAAAKREAIATFLRLFKPDLGKGDPTVSSGRVAVTARLTSDGDAYWQMKKLTTVPSRGWTFAMDKNLRNTTASLVAMELTQELSR
jgi:hypothetical protein